MTKRLSSCCIDCNACQIGTTQNCPGCQSVEGKPFWSRDGVCDLYSCASGKSHAHCGKCGEFPCNMLSEWAFSEPGENGARIDNLRELVG
jgi:hypothetical protein